MANTGFWVFVQKLSSFAHLILFDKRGTELSHPVDSGLPFEERVLDLGAVLDAGGPSGRRWSDIQGVPLAVHLFSANRRTN